MSSYSYAEHMFKLKSSLTQKSLSWFVEPGTAGGVITYRFANGVWLSLVATAWATHPRSQAKPIADLPADFASEAKQMLEGLERDQKSPPPPANYYVY
jgi:hypothetical protein